MISASAAGNDGYSAKNYQIHLSPPGKRLRHAQMRTGGTAMAKIIALCGMICSGKSTYAKKIRQTQAAVVLNPDVLMKTLWGEHLGERHDEIFEKVRQYLYGQAIDIIQAGTDVILDFGLWSKRERRETRDFFQSKGVDFSLHYINTPLSQIDANIKKRNLCFDASTYFIDDTIFNECLSSFEIPDADEIDVEV